MSVFVKAALVAIATLAVVADTRTVCSNATGMHQGRFFTFWHDTGSGCMTLGQSGAYTVKWDLGERGNLVAGTGWKTGSLDRVVRYTARAFEPGRNGYLTLYGWSTDPLIEYYVVDSWGTQFTPPGPEAVPLGEVTSDGGTYRIYRTQRVNQPSIAGTATFYQYWSVRTAKRPLGTPQTITFANHVAAWRKHGLKLGTMNYQVLATEGFGSTGRSDIRLAN
ncbi:glycoside hydrolase family 11 protein [Sphingomonas sp. IC-56]|uniref:glycoside hydrolase family 11 protein n=1 Tax=Sphingomonas sp. IC-56 TaxID=2898529 RepID=UPI001E5FA90D|nr:glycoside hydrolase family 11 protein [Sphingomonas sp. IC-56]MCD2325269.1 glycoside hydrolase family 11 protein [Sphingomonas sp. IC-56]